MATAVPAVTVPAVSVLTGVGAGVGLFLAWPRDPLFEVVSINIAGFKLRFVTDSPLLVAVIDAEMTLSIKVTNKNFVGIQYGETIMNIFYKDTLLGQAKVEPGKQGPRSEEIIEVPSRMDGLQVTGHVLDLMNDVRKRRMSLQSQVTISGHARLLWIRHPFKCHVESDITIDPIFLNIIDQDNRVTMELGVTPQLEPVEGEEKTDLDMEEMKGKDIAP